jgi:hypothetical protein
MCFFHREKRKLTKYVYFYNKDDGLCKILILQKYVNKIEAEVCERSFKSDYLNAQRAIGHRGRKRREKGGRWGKY